MHFVSSLAWKDFVNAFGDAFCGLHGTGCFGHRWWIAFYVLVWWTQVVIHFESTLESADCLLSVVGRIWSTHVKINLLSMLAWKVLFNTSWDTFCVLAGMGWVCSTHVVIHFVSSLLCSGFGQSTQVEIYFLPSVVWEEFVQHKIRHILCLRWHRRGLVITSWDT